MANDKKKGRPVANNVDYFPHKCKDDKELMLIQHKYKSERYEAFYRLQQCLGDAEYHRIDLKNDLEKQMFEMGMSVSPEIIYGVIDILVGMNWLDREVYEKDNVLWSDKFVNSIRAVYINRKRHVPEKKDIYRDSTYKNKSIVEYSIEKKSKEEEREEKQSSLLSVEQYEKLFPDKNVKKSMRKCLQFHENPSHEKVVNWLEKEKDKKPKVFKTSSAGGFIAYCSNCNKQEFPNDNWQIKKGSTCCNAEYNPERNKLDLIKASNDEVAPF